MGYHVSVSYHRCLFHLFNQDSHTKTKTIKKHLLSLFSLQSFSNFQRIVYTHAYLIVHITSSQHRKSNSGSFYGRTSWVEPQLQLVAGAGLAWTQDHWISNSKTLLSFFIAREYHQLWSIRRTGGKNEIKLHSERLEKFVLLQKLFNNVTIVLSYIFMFFLLSRQSYFN